MEVFFNELSVRPAASDAEARRWVETLADAVQLLQNAVESLSENQLVFRRREDFGLLQITPTLTIYQFLEEQFDFLDKEYVLLISVFDSPYISEDDPQRTEYEYTSLSFDDKVYSTTGLAASYLKNALSISFDNHAQWDACQLSVQINRIDAAFNEVSSTETVQHASRKQHIIDCHLKLLAGLFDWTRYKPHFDSKERSQTLFPKDLAELCKSLVGGQEDSWRSFYNELAHLNERERVLKIKTVANQIAAIHRWEPASGTLKSRNASRTIFTIPHSRLIISVDTQHGEFEVHIHKLGNNHLGAISFDGMRFKSEDANRELLL
jgi:hypothetical protein